MEKKEQVEIGDIFFYIDPLVFYKRVSTNDVCAHADSTTYDCVCLSDSFYKEVGMLCWSSQGDEDLVLLKEYKLINILYGGFDGLGK